MVFKNLFLSVVAALSLFSFSDKAFSQDSSALSAIVDRDGNYERFNSKDSVATIYTDKSFISVPKKASCRCSDKDGDGNTETIRLGSRLEGRVGKRAAELAGLEDEVRDESMNKYTVEKFVLDVDRRGRIEGIEEYSPYFLAIPFKYSESADDILFDTPEDYILGSKPSVLAKGTYDDLSFEEARENGLLKRAGMAYGACKEWLKNNNESKMDDLLNGERRADAYIKIVRKGSKRELNWEKEIETVIPQKYFNEIYDPGTVNSFIERQEKLKNRKGYDPSKHDR